MSFDATIRHWRTIAEFAAYLQTVPRPGYVRRLCNHNTFIPNEKTWRGMASMFSMRDYYRDTKKWSSGPHLYLAATAPNAADTGIYQMTPLAHPGTHAGDCNEDALGLEWVGDFDAARPSAAQYGLGITINLLIMHAWGLPPSSVVVHNECMPGRTCPGKYLTGVQIRDTLMQPAPRPAPDPFGAWGDIGKPIGPAVHFAVPRAWLVNKKLGRCVQPETYSKTKKYSVAEFENGMITWLAQRDTTIVEMFT